MFAARWLRQWPILLVLTVMAAAMVFVALDRFRVGSVLLSTSVFLALLLRAFLPDDDVGLLAVRKKSIDVSVLTVLSIALIGLTIWVPPPQ